MKGKASPASRLLCVVFLLVFSRTAAAGGVICVDADAPGADNGSSWVNAYVYLQDALADANTAEKPVEIRVAQGIYRPDQGETQTPGDREATFQLVNGATLKGGYGGFNEPEPDARDIELYKTILSGDLSGNDIEIAETKDLLDEPSRDENSYHVVTGSGTDATAVLDGFTIIGGNADTRSSGRTDGGGMYNREGSPTISNCTFSGNLGIFGGGMHNYYESSPTLTNCTFIGNSSDHGGGMENTSRSNPLVTNCTFRDNYANSRGGGLKNQNECDPILTNCIFINNSAGSWGGGMYNRSICNPMLINCTINGNSAKHGYGGGICNRNFRPNGSLTLINCTFAHNSAPTGTALACFSRDGLFRTYLRVINCIIWDSGNIIWNDDSSPVEISYSDVRGGWPGQGNIKTDPLFVDADGADNIVGTEDDDLRLSLGSPCIGAGDNSAVLQSVVTDLDGNPRIVNGIVDMGAYEGAPSPDVFYYVDAVSGDDNNDGLTPQEAFATIQKGIDAAEDGEVVLVYPGLYQEEINFLGKRITVQGVAVSPAGVPVLQNPGDFAVSFYSGEGPDSILKNFIIKDSFMGVLIVDSSPTISNLTAVNNKYGIEAYADSEPDISNTILWNNTDGDLFGCRARYSCIERGGEGNITDDPLFVDADNGDYHMRSERGRYWPQFDIWVLDKVTSPCVDGGDPQAEVFDEPMPHGGRINIGAYGGTSEASLSPGPALPLLGQAIIHSPIDGEHTDDLSVILTWIPGDNAELHDVYFGTDYDAVANATTESTGIYRGRQPLEKITYDTGILELNKTYYWRIDEIIEADPDNPSKGDVWSFTTAGFIVLDDFEGYDDDYRIWLSWQDSLGYGVPGTEPYVPGNGTGAAVGDETAESYMETFIVHGGRKSLPYSYDNNKPGCFNYSEATMILDNQRNWMKERIEVLSLWFYGDPANIPEPMYMAVANSNGPTAVVYHTDPDAVLINNWTEWTIELREFADRGINLNDVNSIAIGFGDRDNPQPGGSGKMYFDDIRLRMP
jgi:parallel beta-helix repeat protein